ILEPQGLLLVKNGRKLEKNLKKERISDEDLMSQLRLQGIEHLNEVKQVMLESNGHFSVITIDTGQKKHHSQLDEGPGQ
ncbi:MAG: YetF domain-containing protein, partial [Pyrinomonadaceae bacterium]